jgi:hypothetical protein
LARVHILFKDRLILFFLRKLPDSSQKCCDPLAMEP